MTYDEKMESLKDWEDTVKKKLTTHKSYAKEEFAYPMWFKHKKWDYIVKFTNLSQGIIISDDVTSGDIHTYTAHTDNSIWEQVENPNKYKKIEQGLSVSISNSKLECVNFEYDNKAKNPNSKYYELWEDFEAIDVIKLALTDEEYKGFLKGNILKYRLRAGKKNIENDNIIKDINKSIDYERELSK